MTCCLAISINNCSLAAADTRIVLHNDLGETSHDGPHPINIEIESIGKALTIPYTYRKIRKISDGWAVCAGDYVSTTEYLDLLKKHDAILFTQARRVLVGNEALLSKLTLETGIAREQLLKTTIFGAPRGTAATGWTLSLDKADGRTHRKIEGLPAINWPYTVPDKERIAANEALRNTLRHTDSSTTPLAYAKAMGQIISTAAKFAHDVGPFIQIGITHPTNDGKERSIYFEGLTEELLNLNENDFEQRCKIAT